MSIGKATSNTVMLTKNGSLRISSDLLPEITDKNLSYFVVGYPTEKKLELRPANGDSKENLLKRRASFSNGGARSPLVAVRQALRNIGVPLPKKALLCKVDRKRDGTLTIQF